MPAPTPLSDLDIEDHISVDGDRPLECECRHSDRADDRCGKPATVRVTVVCVAEGCNCAAGVSLLCRKCLSVWSANARRDGVELRITPL